MEETKMGKCIICGEEFEPVVARPEEIVKESFGIEIPKFPGRLPTELICPRCFLYGLLALLRGRR